MELTLTRSGNQATLRYGGFSRPYLPIDDVKLKKIVVENTTKPETILSLGRQLFEWLSGNSHWQMRAVKLICCWIRFQTRSFVIASGIRSRRNQKNEEFLPYRASTAARIDWVRCRRHALANATRLAGIANKFKQLA